MDLWSYGIDGHISNQALEILHDRRQRVDFKWPAHSKNEIFYILASAQPKWIQSILVSCEASFRSKLQKTLVQWGPWPALDHWFSKGRPSLDLWSSEGQPSLDHFSSGTSPHWDNCPLSLSLSLSPLWPTIWSCERSENGWLAQWCESI